MKVLGYALFLGGLLSLAYTAVTVASYEAGGWVVLVAAIAFGFVLFAGVFNYRTAKRAEREHAKRKAAEADDVGADLYDDMETIDITDDDRMSREGFTRL